MGTDLKEQALFLGDLSVYPPPKDDQEGKVPGETESLQRPSLQSCQKG